MPDPLGAIGSKSTTLTGDPRIDPGNLSNVVGLETDAGRFGVIGSNTANGAFGSLGGHDPVFSQHVGAYGESDQQGVMGLTTSDSGTGVFGGPVLGVDGAIGVRGETRGGVGVQGRSFGTGLAGKFIGNVEITGSLTHDGDLSCKGNITAANDLSCKGNITSAANITAFDVVLSGGDCAEEFDVAGSAAIEPGTVMVLDEDGAVTPSQHGYDKRVAGIISGAGDFKPGITLDKHSAASNRLPIALIGKVYCKVDAQYASIAVGDLLTTSPTSGHAMKVGDPLKAFGAVIGKALRSLEVGQGLIPVLVALQ